jgi:hypothetical protein
MTNKKIGTIDESGDSVGSDLKNKNFTRKAILLKYCLDHLEEYKADLDFGLVKCFLKSASGGCFEDEEILQYSIDIFDRENLFELIDSFDYTFIYFSGHSYYHNRKIQIPLKYNEFITESEFIRTGKKQWIFMDCCRTNKPAQNSPDFSFTRTENLFPKATPDSKEKWENSIAQMEPFYLMYYVTKLNDFAFNNLHGGYGTQNFFNSLMYKLLLNQTFSFKQFVKEINNPKFAIQQSSFVQGNLDLNRFSTLF